MAEYSVLNERVVYAFGDEIPVTRHPTRIKSRTSLGVYDNGNICYKESSLYSGVNKETEKRWFKWFTNRITTFNVKTLSNGGKYLYAWSRSKGNKHVYDSHPITSIPIMHHEVVFSRIIEMCEKTIGPYPKNLSDLEDKVLFYNRPLLLNKLDAWDAINQWGRISNTKKPSFRTTTPQEFTKMIAKDRYRKDLVKAIANSKSLKLVYLYLDSPDSIHTDWIVEGLNSTIKMDENHVHDFTRRFMDSKNSILEFVPEKHLRKFFIEAGNHEVSDTMRLLEDEEVRNGFEFKGSVEAVHDRAVRKSNEVYEVRRLEAEKKKNSEETKLFEFPDAYENVVEALEDAWFVVGRSKSILNGWSSTMNNCIRGYDYQAKKGSALMLGYYRDNELLANIEVELDKAWQFPGTLRQCLGKYNNHLSSEDFWEITSTLIDYGVVSEDRVSSCWGYEEPLTNG